MGRGISLRINAGNCCAAVRDVLVLRVPRIGRGKQGTGPALLYRLLDRGGNEVTAVSELLRLLGGGDRGVHRLVDPRRLPRIRPSNGARCRSRRNQ